MRLAVIGAGIAGITAAYLLSRNHEVHLFERNEYVGGHTNTRIIADGEDRGLSVDTGFIVCNPDNYPNFYKLLECLGVSVQSSEMSFGYRDQSSGFSYIGPLFRYFVRRPQSFFQTKFLRFLLEQRHFNSLMLELSNDAMQLAAEPLAPKLRSMGISPFFLEHYVAPLVASIWSSPEADVETFPLRTFVVFFRNHGMFELSRIPRWQTIVGGSHAYVKAFEQQFRGTIHRATPVQEVRRNSNSIQLMAAGVCHEFDKVILALHADQALALLHDPTPEERTLLGYWRYHKNFTVLHTDNSFLSGSRRQWASWNYLRDGRHAETPISITYYMNRLQSLRAHCDYFVTLNPPSRIDASRVLYETWYEHPVYTPQAPQIQNRIRTLLGANHTYYCGAYLGYGFHEDGVNSAIAVTEKLGVSL